ncbi:hypothetical protein DPEC_G00338530 [Dallia pectoralis]|uniref:Uncharacterized protein n=1 Tax=Dallia pectoralis TaxID=75939 RepID=A0ACC2F4J2_DALPE|nr:hypothetical protein DPEC_G00338530 [Dallia pectoralis]
MGLGCVAFDLGPSAPLVSFGPIYLSPASTPTALHSQALCSQITRTGLSDGGRGSTLSVSLMSGAWDCPGSPGVERLEGQRAFSLQWSVLSSVSLCEGQLRRLRELVRHSRPEISTLPLKEVEGFKTSTRVWFSTGHLKHKEIPNLMIRADGENIIWA